MSAPAASGRVQQARALLRNEGLANLIKRLLWLAKQKIYESGPVIWIYRPTTIAEAAPADRLLSVVEATPGSEAQQIANRLRPLAPAIEQLRRDIGGIRILVHDGDINEPIYLAWIYAETGLVADRQAITLDLPQGAAMLEDSFIPRSQRGNRHAPLIMDTVGAFMERRGLHTMLGKIDSNNAAALGAARLSGWHQFGTATATVWLNRIVRWKIELDGPHYPGLKSLEQQPYGTRK